MKHSISRQISLVFIAVMAAVLGAIILVNSLVLGKFYVMKMERVLYSAFEDMDEHITSDNIDTDFFTGTFSQTCASNNISLVVLDENNDTIVRTTKGGDGAAAAARLFGYRTGLDKEEINVLKETDSYSIQTRDDKAMGMDFLEMWGTLTSGYYFIMRIPLSGIRNSVSISNQFILIIAVVAIVLGVLIIMLVSRRIAKPIKELTELSTRMAALDFDAKYLSGGSNEIGQLGEHFNQMSETLEKNISELKSANNQLQRDLERRDKTEQMRTEFLSSVSHELKTPLALISGYAEGLQDNVNDDPESRDFYCDVIIDEAGKMTRMVQKLLTLNELEFGKEQVEMKRFDLTQLIAGKIQSSQILAEQHAASLEYEGPAVIHAWGDEFKVEEVLTNYISNAFNHVDGERKIRVICEKKDGFVRTSVFNTGTPIPEESLDQVWGKFYKVDKARTREYGGSGVGLSIVKAIMDSFHQKYGVYNTSDGVVFWFDLEDADKSTAVKEED